MEPRKYLGRTEIAFDLFRMYLGIGLVVRGALIVSDRTLLLRMIDPAWIAPMLIAHAVVLGHLVGGLLLAAGCCTRLAAALQIPTLLGAVFLVHWREGLFARDQSLELAAIVLVALILYALFGSGPLSVDRYLERAEQRQATAKPESQPELPPPQAWRLLRTRPLAAPPTYGPRGAGLVALPDAPATKRFYSDIKLALACVTSWVVVFCVLVASSEDLGAVLCLLGGLVVFGVWRVGRAHFE